MRRITESEIKQTGRMKELVVRAGKYFSVGILLFACLPVLLPLLFFLSVFGFTFVFPLGCTLAGFLCFRKYVGMLWRKLPIPRLSAGCSTWGGRRQRLPAASPTEFIELPASDLPTIETFEAVDPEFDADVVITAQRDAPGDPAIRSWSGADSVREISSDDGTEREESNNVEYAEEDSEREGKDADISVQDGTTITGHDADGTLFENGIRTEARENDSAPEDGTGEERIAEGTSAEDESRREGLDEDILVEDGKESEGMDEDLSGEDESRKEGMYEDTSPEDGNRTEGAVEHIPAEEENRKRGIVEDMSAEGEGMYEDTSPEDGNRTEGMVELIPGEEENRRKGIVEDMSAEGEGMYEDTSPEDGNRTEGIVELIPAEEENGRNGIVEDMSAEGEGMYEDTSPEDGNRTEGMVELIPGEEENRRKGIVEDMSAEGEGMYEDTSPEDGNRTEGMVELIPGEEENRRKGIVEDMSAEGETRVEVREAEPSIESGTKREGKDGDGHVEGENGRNVVGEEGVLQDVGRVREFPQEDETDEKQGYEVEHSNEEKADKNAERDGDFHTLPSAPNLQRSAETLEDEKRTSGFTEIEENGKEDEAQSQPDVTGHPEAVIEEEARNDNGGDNQALVEETTDQKMESSLPDGNLMYQEVDGNDQEKRTDSSTTPGASPSEDSYHNAEEDGPMKAVGVRNFLPHQAHEDDIWTCKDCGWQYPNARPSAKIRRNHKKHCVGHPPPIGNPSPGQLRKGEIERSFSLDSNREGGDASRLAEPDVPNSLNLQHHPKQVAFGDDAAISSAHSGGKDEESAGVRDSESFRSATNEFPPITSESFRSAPDDFPDDRWSGLPSGESQYNEEQDQLAQVGEELQLSDVLNAVKGIVGDKHVSTGSLLTDIEELSGFLGIDLPARSAEVPEMEWAKLAIEVMTVVVGID